jgi:hypothetical protein
MATQSELTFKESEGEKVPTAFFQKGEALANPVPAQTASLHYSASPLIIVWEAQAHFGSRRGKSRVEEGVRPVPSQVPSSTHSK